MPLPSSRDFDIRAYLRILVRQKWIVLATIVIVTAAGYFQSSSQTRLYSASGELIFTRRSTADAIEGTFGGGVDPQRRLATYVRLIGSPDVRKLAVQYYAGAGGIHAAAASDTDIISVFSTSPDPVQAQRTVTAYMRAFIDYRLDAALDDVEEAQKVLNTRIRNLQEEIAAVDARLGRASASERQSLSDRRLGLASQIDAARQQIDRLHEAATFQETSRILTEPSLPTVPFAPKPMRAATQAAGIGIVLGVGFAFLRELLDESVKTREDLEAAVPLAVLGVVPAVSNPKLQPDELVSITRRDSAPAEAYRALRTSIQFMGVDRPLKMLQVTSALAGEGKTTTVANLAVSLANVGQRVIVVDCDLRRPRLHEVFGLKNDVGFTTLLLGGIALNDALQSVPETSRLLVLASGKIPPDPAELLSGQRAKALLEKLADSCDIVLVDSPPVLAVSEAAVVASRVDGTILVASAARGKRQALQHAYESLQRVETSVIGTVLNDASEEAVGYGYGYGYGYSYGTSADETQSNTTYSDDRVDFDRTSRKERAPASGKN